MDRPGEAPAQSGAQGGPSRDGWDAYRNVLALRRLGFTIDEMRCMTTADMIAFTDVACEGMGERGGPQVREATQADIDMLLG